MYDHRRVSPGRESTGSDLYTVVNYDPIHAVCDLVSASINQRGSLQAVPICQPFGGAWELQQNHRPKVAGSVVPSQWGNCARGPRWGMSLPIQPGDLCRVMYVGESMSDPVITEFYRGSGDFGVAWVANQVLSQTNDYTQNTPVDDDEPVNRYDVLLPSGGWIRCSKSGSWVVASAPVDRPKSYIVLDANGAVKIKARGEKDYTIHLEFDPTKEEGRICVGPLEGGSHIEFKDGDITIKAKRNIRFQGQRVDGDLKPGKTSAIDSLASMATQAAAFTPQGQIASLAAQAIGEQVLGGALTPEPSKPGVVVVKPKKKDLLSNLLANPALDGALRGQIGDILTNPQGLLDKVKSGFTDSLASSGIGAQLTQLLGANALSGDLAEITSNLDLSAPALLKDLGVPSWVAEGLSGKALDLQNLQDRVLELTGLDDNQLLSEVLKQAGNYALSGGTAIDARALLGAAIDELPSGLKTRVNGLIENLDITPVSIPRTEKSEIDWLPTTAQRLGAHILRGNNMLGGKANLFDLEQLRGIVADDRLQEIGKVAEQIEGYFANPHQLIEGLPSTIEPFMEQITGIPPELRSVIAKLPIEELQDFPNFVSTVLDSGLPNLDLGAIESAVSSFDVSNFENALRSVDIRGVHAGLSPLGFGKEYLANLIANVTPQVKELLKALPKELFQELQKLPIDKISAIFDNPKSLLSGLDTDLIKSVFGEGFSTGAGVFDMRVQKIAKFNTIPKPADQLQGLGLTDEFHLQTFAEPIERALEYGNLNMPDYWAVPDNG